MQDAERLTGPLAFNLMVKPAGSLCNLNCAYCYYLDKSAIYGGREPMMSDSMLEHFIREYIEANEVPEVLFSWHGGEPLLNGIDFYRRALQLQKKYAGGKTVHNNIQTNGTLVNDEWAAFFRDNGFLVGVSIDGPREVHDRFRKDKSGNGSFDRVMRGIESLHRNGVEYNLMAAVSKASEGKGKEIYTFLKGLGTNFIQFLPVSERLVLHDGERGRIASTSECDAEIAPWSISGEAFGTFLCDIFDIWVKKDVGKWFVDYFDNTLASWCGVQNGICVFSEVCGGNSVVEHNGDLYPCDHYVFPQYRLGNLTKQSIRDLMTGPDQVDFGISKRNSLPQQCLKHCKWYFLCHGECPKHRFMKTASGEDGLNSLCKGYEKFYSHTEPYMRKMRDLLSSGRPASDIMSVR